MHIDIWTTEARHLRLLFVHSRILELRSAHRMASSSGISICEDRLVKSIVLKKFGAYDEITIQPHKLTSSTCNAKEVEVEVKYCGVNFADLYSRQGLIPQLELPHVLGLECAGVVRNVGSEVRTFKKGQRILCYCGDGGMYRETVIIDEKYCFAIPDEIDLENAVALPANYLTAYFCLFEFGNLRPGHTVLIHSCAGGVGWAATQLAKTIKNVTIIGTASRELKYEAVKKNGVDHVISSLNYFEELKGHEDLQKMKFDIIIDSVGGRNLETSQALLNTFGKVVVIGANCAVKGVQKLSIFQLLKLWWSVKDVSASNLVTRNYMVGGLNLSNVLKENPKIVDETMRIIFNMYIEDKIKPRIDSVLEFHQAVQAMKKLASRKNIGKIILRL